MDHLANLGGGTDGNMAPNGPLIAGPPTQPWFSQLLRPVTTGVMSGAELCAGDGCVVRVVDAFNQTAVVPVLVELGLLSASWESLSLSAPRYVLVADGGSAPFDGVSLALTADPGDESGPVAATIGLRLESSDDWSPMTVVSVGTCDPGWGAEASGGSDRVCAPCDVGYYSGGSSLAPCEECLSGTSTNATGSIACLEDAAPSAVVVGSTPWWVWAAIGAGVAALVVRVCVAQVAVGGHQQLLHRLVELEGGFVVMRCWRVLLPC